MGLIRVRTIGFARATVKIGLANLVYNMRRAAWLTDKAGASLTGRLSTRTRPEKHGSQPGTPLHQAQDRGHPFTSDVLGGVQVKGFPSD